MRQIGSIEDLQQAERFAAHLATLGIASAVDTGPGGHVVWVQNEDRVNEAREELEQFRADPGHERYRKAVRLAAAAARERSQQNANDRSRTVDLRERWDRPTMMQAPATFGLMALMVVVAVITGLEPRKHPEFLLRMLFSTDGTFREIQSGEVWRLITPVFLHFSVMHFLFNIMALRDLGMLVESRVGTPRYFGMVLLIAVFSNWAEFQLGSSPLFGGMSGVVYGLFGYAWVRGRMDPDSGLWINPTSVTYIMGWFVLCFLGVLGNIANWAHAGGLIAGAAMGASAPLIKLLRKR